MSSILIFENEPGQCGKCKIYISGAGVCPWYMTFPNGECPLKHIHSVEDCITPLSKIQYKKYIVWENDREELPGGKYYEKEI